MQPFKTGLFQRFTMVGVSNTNQFVGALSQIFPEQIGVSVLGDDVMSVRSGRHNAGTCDADWSSKIVFISMLCWIYKIYIYRSPCFKYGTIFDSPFLVVEVRARMGLPPSRQMAAPRMKSTWPPTPCSTKRHQSHLFPILYPEISQA